MSIKGTCENPQPSPNRPEHEPLLPRNHQPATENQEEDEGEPEGVVAPAGDEGKVQGKEDRRGHEHHVAHGGGGRGPDVDAVVDERRETGEW